MPHLSLKDFAEIEAEIDNLLLFAPLDLQTFRGGILSIIEEFECRKFSHANILREGAYFIYTF